MENSNEIQQKASFFSYRGVTKCLSAGISFLTDNFLHIVKLSLPFAVAFSVLMTAITYIWSNSLFQQVLMGKVEDSSVSTITLGIVLFVLYLLTYAVAILFSGLILRLVHIYSHDLPLKKFKYLLTLKSSLKYSCKSGLFYVVAVCFVLFFSFLSAVPFLFGGEGNIILGAKVFASFLVITILAILALPLNVAFPALIFEKVSALKAGWKGYKKGLKIWGKVFCLNLLISLLGIFIMFVLAMPSLSMISCYNAATLSEVNGDAVHLPLGFNVWYVLILFLTFYLFTFFMWIETVPYCYLYASIKHDELEEAKNQFKI